MRHLDISLIIIDTILTGLCIQLAGMVRSPFPLVDPIMIGPMLALANVYCGAMFPEKYILICIMVSSYAIYNYIYI